MMTKLKLAGVVAALGLTAAAGVAAVRGQEGTGRPAAVVASGGAAPGARPTEGREQRPEPDQADRLKSLEDKVDRLMRATERPGQPGSAPLGLSGRREAPSVTRNASSSARDDAVYAKVGGTTIRRD